MRPALSVILLTTLIGAGQGLLLCLFAAELAQAAGLAAPAGRGHFVAGSVLALLFTGGGAVASLFHLGHPERAWRALAMWRTSWLSREGIALLAFMAALSGYGLLHWLGSPLTLAAGALAALLALALFVCTGMIYACIRFLREWASPLTVVNYLVLGCASGCTLAAAFAAASGTGPARPYAQAAIAFTAAGLLTRSAALWRNARLRPKSTLQSATGIHHPRIVQTSQGFMGGSFNTREFFHHRSAWFLRRTRALFLLGAFGLPLLLLAWALRTAGPPVTLLLLAFAVQYAGLLAERWYFFAQANHPQNLYYQVVG